MCVHHLTDERKQGLFSEIFQHLVPGGWYFNFDPVSPPDPPSSRSGSGSATARTRRPVIAEQHRTPEQHARWENHVRYIIPLDQQLEYLRAAGFQGIDVYWKKLENVIYGGYRPE